jgi:hypothetical protein
MRPEIGASTTARSIAFSSSRTLPGQLCGAQRGERVLREALDALAVLVGVAAEEEGGELVDVARALAERGDLQRDDVEAVEEVFPELALRDALARSRLVAAITRTSTLRVSLPPTRSNVRSWRKRRSLTCVARGISLTSSRKMVPPFACSKRPSRREMAPVNAPFSWPKSSLSSRDSVRAAQLRRTSGAFDRGLALWIISATSSLPVPVSPTMRTLAFDGATCSTRRMRFTIDGCVAITWPNAFRSRSFWRRREFSCRRRARSTERSTTATSTWKSSGFVR